MRDINTIVLDLDGTLLNPNHDIEPKTKQALIKLQEKGFRVVLASGRPTPGMLRYAQELKMNEHHGLIISYNGACVTDCQTNEIIFEQTIPNDLAKSVLDHLESYDVIPMIVNGKLMHVNSVENGIIQLNNEDLNIVQHEAEICGFDLNEEKQLSNVLDFPLYKILVAGTPAYLTEVHKELDAPFVEKMNCVFSAPFYYEFTDKTVDKAKTLSKVAERLNLSSNNFMSFGDGMNDLTMIKYAGMGVAMGNAEPAVKEAADEVTRCNYEEGIYHILNSYFGPFI